MDGELRYCRLVYLTGFIRIRVETLSLLCYKKCDVMFGSTPDQLKDTQAYVEGLRKNLEEARELSRERLKTAPKRRKRYHDAHGTGRSFIRGDRVLNRINSRTGPSTSKASAYHIDQGSRSHQHEYSEGYVTQEYFKVLDLANKELECRFDQESLKLLCKVERLVIHACNFNAMQPSHRLQELYGAEINFNCGKAQLSLLQDLGKTINEQKLLEGQLVIREVTTINMVCGIMSMLSIKKCTFSTFQRVKTYLRATMERKRLSQSCCHIAYTQNSD